MCPLDQSSTRVLEAVTDHIGIHVSKVIPIFEDGTIGVSDFGRGRGSTKVLDHVIVEGGIDLTRDVDFVFVGVHCFLPFFVRSCERSDQDR